MIISYIKK